MVIHEEQYEMSAAYDNINSTPFSSNDILKSHPAEDSKASSAASGKRRICFNNNL